MREAILLLRTLMRSSSPLNVWKYSKDKRKRRKAAGGIVGFCLLSCVILVYCVGFSAVLDMDGVPEVIPLTCALSISALAFLFTLFKTNGYLFGFKDYDLLMSFPFEARTIAAVRFCYMYLSVLPWYAMMSVSLMVGYGICAQPFPLVYPVWVVLTCLIPIIPMLVAAFVGFLVARVSAGIRHRLRTIVQTILMVAVTLSAFSFRFIVESLFKSDEMGAALGQAADAIGSSARLYPPAAWFAAAVAGSVVDALLLIAVTALAFALVFAVVGRSYASINSALATHARKHDFRQGAQRQRSQVAAMIHKEWCRLTGSAVYLTNSIIGVIMACVLGVVALVVDFGQIVATVTENAPFDSAIVQPAIPFVVYFLTGMVATTACTPSLEGKNYWVICSLPIEKERIYQSKMLFNLLLVVPPTVFAIACLCLSAHVPVLDALLYLVLGLSLCAFSTMWGCVLGIRHMRLDWENEIEVVKNGPAMGIYVLTNMFAVMGLAVLVVVLGLSVSHAAIAAAAILVASVLAVLCYLRAMALARRT